MSEPVVIDDVLRRRVERLAGGVEQAAQDAYDDAIWELAMYLGVDLDEATDVWEECV